MENIHPIFDTILNRRDKEKLLRQHSIVVWMVGLSGSGKSTLARAMENRLYAEGYMTQLLDGDNLRTGINNNLGFSEEDRTENIRRSAETAKLFMNAGIITICSFISPTREVRALAKSIIGEKDYFEVYVNAPIEVCESRDVKGLYRKARNGEIKNFTGLDAPFEAPEHANVEVRTDLYPLEDCLEQILRPLYEKIKFSNT
ncbi:MAG: adenylyl-sulfate kinase [Cytophagaceae bacterium]|nr:adenylyl-sulfate kinase [Cytophagaceae bacterium]MDW8455317.1 adenylyl-sulfate kinase [Cytophagaceae bacterium]